MIRIGCAAHARRKFRRALRDGDRRAIAFIAQFRRLYRVERQTKDLAPEARHQIRQHEAAPLWAQQASSDQRISRRETDYRVGSAVFESGRATSCRVVDKSHAVLPLELQGSEACPEEFALTIPTLRFIGIVRKAWQSESQVGVTIVRWQEAS